MQLSERWWNQKDNGKVSGQKATLIISNWLKKNGYNFGHITRLKKHTHDWVCNFDVGVMSEKNVKFLVDRETGHIRKVEI